MLASILAAVVVALARLLLERADLRARVLAEVETRGSRREATALAWLVESARRRDAAAAQLRVRDPGDAPTLLAPADGACPVCRTRPGEMRPS